jgi:hypothetical protein
VTAQPLLDRASIQRGGLIHGSPRIHSDGISRSSSQHRGRRHAASIHTLIRCREIHAHGLLRFLFRHKDFYFFGEQSNGKADGSLSTPLLVFTSGWANGAIDGLSLTFSNVALDGTNFIINSTGRDYGITSGKLTLALSPHSDPTAGTLTGAMSLVSPLLTLTGPISGSYTVQ